MVPEVSRLILTTLGVSRMVSEGSKMVPDGSGRFRKFSEGYRSFRKVPEVPEGSGSFQKVLEVPEGSRLFGNPDEQCREQCHEQCRE